MGDHREQFVDLTTSLSAAGGRVEEVRAWLSRSGWSSVRAVDDWLFPAAACVEAGPRLHELVPGLRHASVGVAGARTISEVCWYLGDSTGPADCPRCSATAGDSFWDALSIWSAQETEPVLVCSGCGFTARVGEWDLSGSVAVGSVAVVLDLSGDDVDLDHAIDSVLSELGVGLGGRWAHVHRHL